MKQGLLLLALLPLIALAEGYRWTDENGNVHFSDQPPRGQDQDKADPVELKNPDPIGQGEGVERTRQEMEEMRRERQKRERKARRDQKRQEQQRLQKCQSQSRRLSLLKNSRVKYKQEDGSYEGVSMDEHQARIRELENWINHHCRD